MNELTRFGALSARRTEAALLRGNAVTERFGLTLTPEQCGRLLARRASALRETERIEPGEGGRAVRLALRRAGELGGSARRSGSPSHAALENI